MPLTETEREITQAVVRTFLTEDKPTLHRLLIRSFKQPQALERLVRMAVLAQIGNRESYLPRVLAFHYCGEEQALHEAKSAITVVLHVLQNLFDVSLDKDTFTPADVEQHANRIYDLPPLVKQINLGLFLLTEFANVFSTCGFAGGLTRISSFTMADNFVTLKNVEEAWDEHVRRQSVYVENSPESIEGIFGQEAAVETSSAALGERPQSQGSLLVLISHSSKDAELATALIELLRAGIGLLADQIRCSSVDGYRLPVGVNTEKRLREEVNAAPVVVGLITPNSLSSHYVMFELGARWGANLFVAPLLAGVEASKLSGPLSLLNALSANNDAQLHQLVANIGGQLGLRVQSAASYVRHVSALKGLSDAIPDTTTVMRLASPATSPLRETKSSPVNVEFAPWEGQHDKMYLTITNRGPKQSFQAQCRILARRHDPNPPILRTYDLQWEYGGMALSLVPGQSGNLLIASAGENREEGMEWMKLESAVGLQSIESRWERGNKTAPEYDLEIRIIGHESDKPQSDRFTVRAGSTRALEMFLRRPENN